MRPPSPHCGMRLPVSRSEFRDSVPLCVPGAQARQHIAYAIQYQLGCVYWFAHRYDPAIEQLEKALDFDPNFTWSHGFLGFAYEGKSAYGHAIAAMQKAVDLSPGSTLTLLALAEAYALAGKREEAQRMLDQVEKLSTQQYVTPYFRARVYAALGEQEAALRWLETGYRERASIMAFLKVDPQFDKLRTHTRFEHLMRRTNFPVNL